MGLFVHSDMEPVYAFPMDCWKCGNKITVYFPEDTAFANFDIPTLKKVYSRTQESYTIGNVCPFVIIYSDNIFASPNPFYDVMNMERMLK